MPVPRYRFFTPSDAVRVSKLQFTARQVVEGIITGQHKSPHRGFSVEFSEHREYVPGDELRHLDWRAFARTDRHYIKLYEQETNLRATVLIDNSASMGFAGKIDYARHLAACLAYLLSTQQDMVGLVAVDDSVRIDLPPASSPAHLDRMFRALETLEAGKETALCAQLHKLVERLHRRSLVIIISDLWLDADEFARALQHLRYRNHQAIVLHLLDRAEIELPYDKLVTLEDLETGQRQLVDARDVREAYRAQVEDYLAKVRRAANDCDAEYFSLFVDEPYQTALTRLMNRRG